MPDKRIKFWEQMEDWARYDSGRDPNASSRINRILGDIDALVMENSERLEPCPDDDCFYGRAHKSPHSHQEQGV